MTWSDGVVHLVHSGGFYGAERMLLDHCLHVPGRHKVIFLDTSDDALPQRFLAAGVTCASLCGLKALMAELQGCPGLINAHNFRAQVFGWICARRLRLPLALTQHGFTPRSAKQRLYAWIGLRLGMSRRVRRIACVSQGIARLHARVGVSTDKLEVIPNGLPQCRGAPPPRQAAAPLVGFVGRLSAEKGPDLFLDALIPLCAKYPDLQAVMLGDGPLAASLQTRVAAAGLGGRIRLPGYQRDMEAWFARLSVLALSSRTEGTPMVLLEAMRGGVPIAACAVGGVPDMIEDGANGLLAPPGDAVLLSRQIERLLIDADFAGRLAAAGRLRQERDYDLAKLAARWQRFYALVREGAPC
ncbi:MAG: glycosyltransferase family 4 protein [Zoogloeaceae bacterium]|jgi:glycosyltransferase involved in cell wall biosynthesis|nr:glycosyltransferase family 4 protein [Zoogloeaceae bacterium]